MMRLDAPALPDALLVADPGTGGHGSAGRGSSVAPPACRCINTPALVAARRSSLSCPIASCRRRPNVGSAVCARGGDTGRCVGAGCGQVPVAGSGSATSDPHAIQRSLSQSFWTRASAPRCGTAEVRVPENCLCTASGPERPSVKSSRSFLSSCTSLRSALFAKKWSSFSKEPLSSDEAPRMATWSSRFKVKSRTICSTNALSTLSVTA
mmetsp:Transcript_17414/g.40967  ORF Transcript_17414/g.40967 Transcript_17414/m.40967 type:complete len:209 (+) Transcript_17414:389-1015(+)